MNISRLSLRSIITILVLSGLLVFSAGLGADTVGRIEFFEGDVELLRNGETRDTFQLNPGDQLFGMDVIQTGFDGYVEATLTAGGRSTIRIRENTAYYVEVEQRTGGGTETRLRILTGSLEASIHELSRDTSFSVTTRTATLGVRGTEFDIITAPDESTLAGVRSGRVEVTAAGRQVRVEGGSAVETHPDQAPRVRTVPEGDFDRYYATWTETRLQAFRNGAPTFVRAYARRFRDTEPTFRTAYQDLMRHRDRLKEAAQSEARDLGTDMRLKTEVGPALIRMRSILPLFENTVYRLRELSRFHDQGIGVTRIDDESSTQFFNRFSTRERTLMQELSEIRAVFRFYRTIEQRSFGGLPGGNSPFGGGSPIDSMRF